MVDDEDCSSGGSSSLLHVSSLLHGVCISIVIPIRLPSLTFSSFNRWWISNDDDVGGVLVDEYNLDDDGVGFVVVLVVVVSGH